MSTALSAVGGQDIRLGSLAPSELSTSQEGPLLALRMLVDTAHVAQVFEALNAPQ